MVSRLPTLFLLSLMLAAAGAPLSAQDLLQLPAEQLTSARETIRPLAGRSFDAKNTTTIQYDDGEIDNGYGATPSIGSVDLAMRFDLPASGLELTEVELCLIRGGTDSTLDFFIPVWSPGGSGGTPGALLDLIPAQANDIQPGGTFFTFDLSGQEVMIPGSTVFLGAGWNPSVDQDIFLCADQDGGTVQPGFSRINQGNWSSLLNIDPDYTSLMVRGTFESEDPSPGTCTPDANTLCLNDDRFRVEVDWRTPAGATGRGQAVMLTDDTGYFWFFNPANVEMVLKVLNGCPVNDRFWVFAGGLTNVEVQIVVTDTQTGTSKPYLNPLGTPFQPIQDTRAFATCP